MAANKQVTITLFDGDPIKITGKSSWGNFFPDAASLNEKYKSGDKFISVKDDAGETNTLHIENIKHVHETELVEESETEDDETPGLPF